MKDPQTYSQARCAARLTPRRRRRCRAPPAPTSYKSCAISQPPNSAELANVDSLTVVVATQPVLHAGDQIFVLLDGQALKAARRPERSSPSHRWTAASTRCRRWSKGPDGSVLCSSASVTFNVHQPSIANPANPVRPH